MMTYVYATVAVIGAYWLGCAILGVIQGVRAAIRERRRIEKFQREGLGFLPARSLDRWKGDN